jgi:hypothetical protein
MSRILQGMPIIFAAELLKICAALHSCAGCRQTLSEDGRNARTGKDL